MIVISATDKLSPRLGFREERPLNCLFISPHADDLEIASGGTIARLVFEERADVTEIVLTDSTGFVRSFALEEKRIVDIRRREATQAAQLVGVVNVKFGGLRSIKDTNTHAYVLGMLCALIEQTKPDIVFMPHPSIDPHPTHQSAAILTLQALEEVAVGDHVIKIAYAVWAPFPAPDLLVDISSYYRLKEFAINKHVSQVHDRDYAQAILGLNSYYALGLPTHHLGISYAEPFILL